MATQTSKAGYTLDATGQIGVQHANWDRADQIAGMIYTTKAVGPPANAYAGCMVVEKDTGISYRMIDSGGGVLVKKYVSYPFQMYGQNQYDLGSGTQGANGWNQVGDQINYDSSWAEGGTAKGVKIQVKALYLITVHAYIQPKPGPWGSNQNMDVGYYINKTLNPKHQSYYIWPGFPWAANLGLSVVELLNVNDILNAYVYNNSTILGGVNQTLRLTLLKPVW